MNSEIKCPICMEAPLYPRLYECGHTVCEICTRSNNFGNPQKYTKISYRRIALDI